MYVFVIILSLIGFLWFGSSISSNFKDAISILTIILAVLSFIAFFAFLILLP